MTSVELRSLCLFSTVILKVSSLDILDAISFAATLIAPRFEGTTTSIGNTLIIYRTCHGSDATSSLSFSISRNGSNAVCTSKSPLISVISDSDSGSSNISKMSRISS